MPILESEEQRSRVKRALSEIRDATDADADANERQDIAAKYQWRELIEEFRADLLGVDRQ
jgi:hypothetical protein